MYGFDIFLTFADLLEIDRRICAAGDIVKLPYRSPVSHPPVIVRLEPVESIRFMWHCHRSSPPVRWAIGGEGDYIRCYGAEAIQCAWFDMDCDQIGLAQFSYDDVNEQEPYIDEANQGRWDQAGPEFMNLITELHRIVSDLCYKVDRNTYATKNHVSALLEQPDPPEWALALRKKVEADKKKQFAVSKKAVGGTAAKRKSRSVGQSTKSNSSKRKSRMQTPRSYQESFDLIKASGCLDGGPRPEVAAVPAYEDEPTGPSFFRTEVTEQDFSGITLPGLYVGYTLIEEVKFTGSNLHLSAFNWSEFNGVDFSGCDLHDSDLRGSEFRDCSFRNADLSRCDLRGSSYEDCNFTGAKLDGAQLLNSQGDEIKLTPAQRASATWTDEYQDPSGD